MLTESLPLAVSTLPIYKLSLHALMGAKVRTFTGGRVSMWNPPGAYLMTRSMMEHLSNAYLL